MCLTIPRSKHHHTNTVNSTVNGARGYSTPPNRWIHRMRAARDRGALALRSGAGGWVPVGRDGIFINYRGTDSQFAANLLHAALAPTFGQERVFLDSASLQPGDDFVDTLLRRVRDSRVVLAVIGPSWLTATAPDGSRLIDNPADWIRRELVEAFRAGAEVIPVLTDHATMPTAAELPADIAQLGRTQYQRLGQRSAHTDLPQLVQLLRRKLPGPQRRPRRPAVLALALLAVIAVALPVVVLNWPFGSSATGDRSGAPPSTTTGPAGPRTPAATTEPAPTTAASPARPAPTSPPNAADFHVRWQGSLVLGGYGGPGGGWFLDSVPPHEAITGDLYYNDVNQVAGNTAVVGWMGNAPPGPRECAALLFSHLGLHTLDVQVGSSGCFRTAGGRVGYLRVDQVGNPNDFGPKITVDVTVWDVG